MCRQNYNDTPQLMADWFGPVKEEEWKGMSTIDMSNRGYDWMTGGNGFTKNLELAKRCLRAAADRGDGAACCNLGWCYDQEGKSDKANEVYFKGANLNCTTAMLNLARNLHNGRGWPKDDSGARLYLKMAHDAGDKRGAERLAEFFPEDEVREKSKNMTLDEINNRAWAYMKGFDGQERDVKKAALWFDVAATKGLVAAWYGNGTPSTSRAYTATPSLPTPRVPSRATPTACISSAHAMPTARAAQPTWTRQTNGSSRPMRPATRGPWTRLRS